MTDAGATILNEAIARNAPVVLSLPSAGMLRHHKSRFLASMPEGFWIESIPADAPLIDQLISTGQSCGVSFRGGPTKVVFSTAILKRETSFTINEQLAVEAVLLRQPAQIKAIQRRENYRVHIPMESRWLSVRLWRIGQKADLSVRPMDAQEITAQICDLSATGIGVILSGQGNQPPRIDAADRLRVELNREGQTLLLEGRLCYPSEPPAKPSFRAGIQFARLQDGLDGRQMQSQITRLVGDLQREEIRLFRLDGAKT